MATRNAVQTKKLKTGQKVTVNNYGAKWASVHSDGAAYFHESRREAREWIKSLPNDQMRIVRLNPITGVVSK